LVVLAGCGQKSDGNFFVTGTITQSGQVLEGVRVAFIPDGDGSGEAASGATDANGKYVLTTSSGKDGTGTKPGSYRVTVTKTDIVWDGSSYLPPTRDEPDVRVKDEKVVQLLPVQYSNFANTPLKATVTEKKDTNVFDFDIP